jgi:hypothetical protein
MPELHWQIKRLEALKDKCGGKKKDEKPPVDMSKMTEYEKAQYKLAEQMQRIRNNILELDNLPEGAPAAKRVELKQQIRKDTMKLDEAAKDARRWAKEENRKDEYEKLLGHVKKTQGLWNSRHQSDGGANGANSDLMSPKSGNGIQKLDEEMSQLNQPMVSLHDDEEFQMFFDQVSKRDEEIDQALDMISAGVQVLHNQAKVMNQELKIQKELITTAEQKMDNVTDQLVGLNKKLKKTIKEVQKDRLCLYVICCLLLLALAGTIYFVTKGDSK